MARIPAYPYRVIVSKRVGETQLIEQHNYTSLPGAWMGRDIALRKRNTRKVEVVVVLDESTPAHPE